jgi:hypothetical protein
MRAALSSIAESALADAPHRDAANDVVRPE